MTIKLTYSPDYAVAPGATLKELLDEKGISQTELAVRTGLAEKTVSQIINGIAPVTYETSEKLELALGVPARFWNTRELHYREALSRVEEEARLAKDVEWLAEVPVKELVRTGHVKETKDKSSLTRDMLAFFGVSSVEAWRNAWLSSAGQYRGKEVQQRKPGHVAAWRRIGEIAAGKIECAPFDPKRFREALQRIRELSTKPASVWYGELIRLCAEAGVAVVLVPEIPGAAVSGVARWLTKDKALIQLSLKYKTDDQLWFTFFHEAAHILLHSKREIFIDDGTDSDDEEEAEANQFARDLLIPPAYAGRLSMLKARGSIVEFARLLGISPGIVVGRLQKDALLSRKFCNDLKVRLEWQTAIELDE